MQTGAVCDLAGLRLRHLSKNFVDDTLERHPRTGFADSIMPMIRAEADAVPDGRFALLHKSGFTLVIRMAPLPS